MARIAGWTPEIFWNATPAEAAMVLGGWREGGGDWGAPPPDAALRAQLMEMFPDG
ncbi:MAG: phage tail assembly chaperone [Sphingopyxis sp.]|nr:phage tail assembly chaperone [Sphingopyxis sp.]